MKTLKEFLTKAYTLQLMEGSFSAHSLSRSTGMSYGYSSNTLTTLHEKGLVKNILRKRILGSGGRSRIRGLTPARYILTKRGRSRIKVVLAGGVFELMHPGHLAVLREACKHGDLLVVVVARDSTVKRSKGRNPLVNQEDRLSLISSLREVDAAILGSPSGYQATLEKVDPDTVFLGYDQERDLQKMNQILTASKKRIQVIKSSHQVRGYSTSTLIRRIKGS